MASSYGSKHFGFVPKTYVLPAETKELQVEMNKDRRVEWIVKPANSCQGRGIFVTKKFEEIPEKADLVVS